MIIPIFLTIVVAITEFSFLFTSYISVGYASHDAVQLAATYGNTPGADCAILQRIDSDIAIPANPKQITSVDIFWVNTSSGSYAAVPGAENLYTYDGGAHQCQLPDLSFINVPFSGPTPNGYPENTRCNVNQAVGCPATNGIAHTTVDTIGVKITYQYSWITPFPRLILGGTGSPPLITSVNIMRLEPVL